MKFNFKTFDGSVDQRGKKVFVAVDFNVQCDSSGVVDDFRIRKTVPTLRLLKNAGAKTFLVTHSGKDGSASLLPVFEYLKKEFDVVFAKDLDEARVGLETILPGQFVLLENVRRWEGEVKNDEIFAKNLASLCEVYINEAFSVSHRSHASIVGVPRFLPSFAGPLFASEVENLSLAFSPPRPALVVLGGEKFSTKAHLIEKFLKKADWVFVCGALSNYFFKAKGFNVGQSNVSDPHLGLENWISNDKVILPIDIKTFGPVGLKLKKPDEIESRERVVDAGPETMDRLKPYIEQCKFILWNGPLGESEKGYPEATNELSKMLAESGAKTVVGGGDTVSAITAIGLENKFTFVSTGGGAMLDFLANETLPGIEALNQFGF